MHLLWSCLLNLFGSIFKLSWNVPNSHFCINMLMAEGCIACRLHYPHRSYTFPVATRSFLNTRVVLPSTYLPRTKETITESKKDLLCSSSQTMEMTSVVENVRLTEAEMSRLMLFFFHISGCHGDSYQDLAMIRQWILSKAYWRERSRNPPSVFTSYSYPTCSIKGFASFDCTWLTHKKKIVDSKISSLKLYCSPTPNDFLVIPYSIKNVS